MEFVGSAERMSAVSRINLETAFAGLLELVPTLVEINFSKQPEPPPPSPPGGFPKIFDFQFRADSILADYVVELDVTPEGYSYTVDSHGNRFLRTVYVRAGNILSALVSLATAHELLQLTFKQEM